jgi:hypothetical protein
MNEAVVAAQAGDCAAVAKLEAEVDDLDAGFHDRVFVHDARIASCQASSRANLTKDPKTANDPPLSVDPKPAMGTLVLDSKPSCEIYIDHVNSGLHTPQLELRLLVGEHRITLYNDQFGINDEFIVGVTADAGEKIVKDYSDHLPK